MEGMLSSETDGKAYYGVYEGAGSFDQGPICGNGSFVSYCYIGWVGTLLGMGQSQE